MQIDDAVLAKLNRQALALYTPTLATYTEVLEALDKNNGMNATALAAEVGISRNTARDMLATLRAIRAVRVEIGPGRSHTHRINHDDLDVLFA